MIVEYKLHKVKAHSDNKKTPIWIDEGGHYYDSNNHTYVGCIRDSVEYYVPKDTLTIFTKSTFHQKILDMHARSPFMEPPSAENPDQTEPTLMTTANVGAEANTFWDTKAAIYNTD